MEKFLINGTYVESYEEYYGDDCILDGLQRTSVAKSSENEEEQNKNDN